MESFAELYGNAGFKATVGAELSAGRPSHAYILEGPAGSGRHTAARLIASAIFCKDRSASFPCGKCLSCRKVSQGISPDVIYVNRGDRATIGIDVIRDLRASLSFAPVEEDKKIYIIEEADKMTAQAQNSLLLSLEEPPSFVVFILLCTDSTLLLETVRSRAPVIRMELLGAGEIVKYLSSKPEYSKLGKRLEDASALSGGSVGRTIELLSESDAEEFRDADLCREIMPTLLYGGRAERNALLKRMPSKRDEAISFLTVVMSALRDVLSCKKTDGGIMLFYADRDDAAALASRVSAKRLVTLYDAAQSAVDRIASNVNIQAATELFLTEN